MKLSIIIVTYNSAADIKTCLSSIGSGHNYEVIVVDNASQDKTQEIVRQFPGVKLILNEKNLGYARANNQGITISQGEYILLLNPDTVLQNHALDLMTDFLDHNPDVAGVAPCLLNPNKTTQLSVRSFPTFGSVLWELTGLPRLFPKCPTINRWRRRDFNYNKPQFVDQPMASCLLLRRSIIIRLGGFDEQFPIFYNDVDLCYRLAQQGEKIAYLPDAKVIHKLGASTNPLKTKMIYENHRSLFRFLKKHNAGIPFFLKAVILLPVLEASALIRVIAWWLRNIGGVNQSQGHCF